MEHLPQATFDTSGIVSLTGSTFEAESEDTSWHCWQAPRVTCTISRSRSVTSSFESSVNLTGMSETAFVHDPPLAFEVTSASEAQFRVLMQKQLCGDCLVLAASLLSTYLSAAVGKSAVAALAQLLVSDQLSQFHVPPDDSPRPRPSEESCIFTRECVVARRVAQH